MGRKRLVLFLALGFLIFSSLSAPLLGRDQASGGSSEGVDDGYDPAARQFPDALPSLFGRGGMGYVFLLHPVRVGEGRQCLFKGNPVPREVGLVLLLIPLPLHYVHSVSIMRDARNVCPRSWLQSCLALSCQNLLRGRDKRVKQSLQEPGTRL